MSRVYVVMGNDYPAEVFVTSDLAQAYCEKRAAEPESKHALGGTRIYWRYYDFELLYKLPEKAS